MVIEQKKGGETVQAYLEKLIAETSAWPGMSIHAHRFGGTEFRLGDAEVGHVHPGGIVDIPFPRAVRNELLAQKLAGPHHWLPNSGWITFRAESEEDVSHALWLLRLSYLRYTLKTVADPRGLLEAESARLQLGPQFTLLFEKFAPATVAA